MQIYFRKSYFRVFFLLLLVLRIWHHLCLRPIFYIIWAKINSCSANSWEHSGEHKPSISILILLHIFFNIAYRRMEAIFSLNLVCLVCHKANQLLLKFCIASRSLFKKRFAIHPWGIESIESTNCSQSWIKYISTYTAWLRLFTFKLSKLLISCEMVQPFISRWANEWFDEIETHREQAIVCSNTSRILSSDSPVTPAINSVAGTSIMLRPSCWNKNTKL